MKNWFKKTSLPNHDILTLKHDDDYEYKITITVQFEKFKMDKSYCFESEKDRNEVWEALKEKSIAAEGRKMINFYNSTK